MKSYYVVLFEGYKRPKRAYSNGRKPAWGPGGDYVYIADVNCEYAFGPCPSTSPFLTQDPIEAKHDSYEAAKKTEEEFKSYEDNFGGFKTKILKFEVGEPKPVLNY